MDKALKSYQKEVKKYTDTINASNEEQRKLSLKIEEIKSGVKADAKKGIFKSVLQRDDVEELSKLLAQQQLLQVQIESIEESGMDKDVYLKAIQYIQKAEEQEKKLRNEMTKAFEDAKEQKLKYEKIMSDNDYPSKRQMSHRLFHEVKRNLSEVVMKDNKMNTCSDLNSLKKELEAKLG